MTKTLSGMDILGIAAAVPSASMPLEAFTSRFDAKSVEKIRKVVGVHEIHVAGPKQTASDLAFVAAEALKKQGLLKADEVDVLLFVSQSADYVAPCTAAVLAHRLGLPRHVLAFDVNLGCTGFLSGLLSAAAHACLPGVRRVLLLGGDCLSKLVAPLDKTAIPLFGDAGYAALIGPSEQEHTPWRFNWETDGSRFRFIMIPGLTLAGRYPCLYDAAGKRRELGLDVTPRDFGAQMVRGDEDFYMDGMELFNYTANDAPLVAQAILEAGQTTPEDYDWLVLHQANLFIMKQVALSLGFRKAKMPISIDRYGNTSGATIPVTLADMVARQTAQGRQHLLCVAFGVGLATTAIDLTFDFGRCLPLIETDETFDDDGLDFKN